MHWILGFCRLQRIHQLCPQGFFSWTAREATAEIVPACKLMEELVKYSNEDRTSGLRADKNMIHLGELAPNI